MKFITGAFLALFSTFALAVQPPQIVNATINSNSVTVNWSAADPLAWGHNVFRNGSYLGTSFESYYTDEGVANGSYRYTVSAFANNQFSAQSMVANADIGGDSGAANICSPDHSGGGTATTGGSPTTPANFRASIYSQTSFELLWDRSSDDGYITGYELKRDGVFLTQNDATSYYEGSVAAGRTYSYELVAIDNSGNRSSVASLSVNSTNGTSTTANAGGNTQAQTNTASWPSNNREASGRAVIPLQGSNNGYFYTNNRRYVSIDAMPDESYFTNKGDWTCSYYTASGTGFIIEPTYRSSTWTFAGGGSGTFNITPITWSLNNTDITIANLFFDLVEVESDYLGTASQYRYQNTIRFWETTSRFFECQSSSNNR